MNNKNNRTVSTIAKRLEILRTAFPMILKAAAWIAYPWLFALVKVSRRLGNLCG